MVKGNILKNHSKDRCFLPSPTGLLLEAARLHPNLNSHLKSRSLTFIWEMNKTAVLASRDSQRIKGYKCYSYRVLQKKVKKVCFETPKALRIRERNVKSCLGWRRGI